MNALKEKRLAQGLTRSTLAKLVGVDKSTVGKWDRSITRPTDQHLKRLAAFFGCTVEELGYLLNKTESKLTARRLAAGYTQEELGAKVGVSRRALWKWESGKCVPQDHYLSKLTALFQCGPEDLGFQWKYGGPPPPPLPQKTVDEQNALFLQYMNLIPKAIHGSWGYLTAYNLDKEDVYQHLAVVMLRAIQMHDPRKGELDRYLRRFLRLEIKQYALAHRLGGIKGVPLGYRLNFSSVDALAESGVQFRADMAHF